MIRVKKRSGELVPFDPSKIESSLERVGTSEEVISNVLKSLEPKLYDGISTKKIFSIVFGMLEKQQKPAASKFNLKTAITGLGPTGHHFETFICNILREKGYQTKVRQTLEGKCITHEVDVIAVKNGEQYVAECKFHSQPWSYCPIQNALYTYARYLDLISNKNNSINKVMLITNTRFSVEVIKYAECVGMSLLGWKYPRNEGLEKVVDEKDLYPITILYSLNTPQMEKLLNEEIVLVRDIKNLDDGRLQKLLNCRQNKVDSLRKEVNNIIGKHA